MKYDFHNAISGKLSRCQISNKDDLLEVIDLGHQPLCDNLLEKEQLNCPEKFYPLRLCRSPSLGHAQLDYIVPSEEVYFSNYPYRPGITKEVVEHHKKRASEAISKLNIKETSLIVDIGSNDGILLDNFKKLKMRVLGVEPTNTAKIAESKNIKTIQNFFNQKVAKEIILNYGKPTLVTATNVFAHMADLGNFMNGLNYLLEKDSYFILENHYIVNILKDNQYDTIYHEHIRSYSLKSLVYLFALYGINVVDAEIVNRYGGTIRVTVTKKEMDISKNVKNLLEYEKHSGIFEDDIWIKFKKNIIKSKNNLMEFAINCSKNGKKLVGKSCPGRCSTLINFVGLDKNLLPYITEQPSSLKLGKFLPGKHIPILEDEILFKDKPDYIIIFAWHYGKEIIKDLKNRGIKSKFVLPLPELTIID